MTKSMPQVHKSHYEFGSYMSKRRWISLWYQIDEILRLKPRSVLEIGPGPGLLKANIKALGISLETLDLDPSLKPDHIGSALDIPFKDSHFDVVCAFQMLEHLPFEESTAAFCEMARVAKGTVIISLPDAFRRWPISIEVPAIGTVNFSIPRPRLKPRTHKFDGEHYWEVNKIGYSTAKVIEAFCSTSGLSIQKTYRIPENPYHRIFIFS